ncbi:CRISPR-associated endoribonuclease Cas6 [Methanobrevibacter sp.]|uniref:CRISPR-associated endoribonuclease Cas6 n=1 Tax=Methanobrevibacter sp. TaxID=66852 RepID=UPI0026DF0657|nr:CRISPR-associated endoribonuclease Cas6 [Methanobrevibacter sp.]MDO5824548.1 CRISPR-associated endoribonuclease Cas6 [Methanobrevibacter sp.]
MIKFEPKERIKYSDIDKYTIQGFIYSILENDSFFYDYHDNVGFKFFNFSNIFPVSDFEKNTLKKLIISSPNDKLIKSLYKQLKNKTFFRLKNYKMELLKIELLTNKNCSKFISSTPIVLFEDNKNNQYYSFKKNPDFNFFFERLKDNAIKKYNAFYGYDFNLDSELFTNFEFGREVSIRLTKNNNKFIVIGSLWKNLEFNLTTQNKDFYNFLFENGLGEKNSLGFGFLNCRK